MSSQKNPNIQKMGMSLQITQKQALLQCSFITCYDCYRMYPNGFYCPRWKTIDIPISKIPRLERKTIEDFFLL